MTTMQPPKTDRIPFGSLRVQTHPALLQPREWTSAQSRWAALLLRDAPPGRVLELCAGAGQIGLLAVHDTDRRLLAIDREPMAAAVTEQNALALGMADRVEARCGPLDAVLEENERFAVALADPPWVPSEQTSRYPEDPVEAIDGGSDGLEVARRCVYVFARHLLPGGRGILQLGTRAQAEALDVPHPLVRVEIHEYIRGVLVRFDRPHRRQR